MFGLVADFEIAHQAIHKEGSQKLDVAICNRNCFPTNYGSTWHCQLERSLARFFHDWNDKVVSHMSTFGRSSWPKRCRNIGNQMKLAACISRLHGENPPHFTWTTFFVVSKSLHGGNKRLQICGFYSFSI